MPRGEFREIDHPADLGLDLSGPDVGSVLEAAQRGLVEVLFGGQPALEPAEEREVSVAAPDGPELLKEWCERLYRMIEDDGFVPLESTIVEASVDRLRARVRGARAPRDVLVAASELKAVTWHQLALAPDPSGGWRGRVIFDV